MNTRDDEMKKAKVCIVVAISREKRAIGLGGKLLWHIPEDMKRFKALTVGHPVIMGRKTFESILGYLGKPLPDRTNIVVTRDPSYTHEGVEVFTSLDAALARAHELDTEEVHIGGGAEMYQQALPLTDRLYLTIVDDEPDADTFFPEYDEFTKIISEEKRDHDGLSYTWLTLERE